jgi:hypothetical protein
MPRKRKIQSPSEIALEIFKQNWSKDDIISLKDLLDCILEPPAPPSRQLPRGRRGGGYVEKKTLNGKSYFYHRYIHEGKRRSVYIGKSLDEPPAGIEGLVVEIKLDKT